MTREKTIVKTFLADSFKAAPMARVYTNPVGFGWTGKQLKFDGYTAILEAASPIEFGLEEGSADVVGWETLIITPEMIGEKIARFISVEFKRPGGRIRPKQPIWMSNVNRAGGRACIVDTVLDAYEFLKGANGGN